MTNWKYVVELNGFWDNDDIPIEKKGKLVAEAIKRAFPLDWFDWTSENYNNDLDDITEAFENITGFDDVSPVEEFDNWMEELYNFGDTEVAPFRRCKMAWIKTKF